MPGRCPGPAATVQITMSANDAEYQRKFRALQENFIVQLAPKQRAIAAHWQQLQQQWQPGELDALYLVVHRLAGAGETFGFPQLSQRARALDHLLLACSQSAAPPAPETRGQLQDAVEALLGLIEQLRAGSPG